MTEENSISDICDGMNLPFKLKDLQLESLKAVVNGKDLFAVLPTGYGKTVLIYFNLFNFTKTTVGNKSESTFSS